MTRNWLAILALLAMLSTAVCGQQMNIDWYSFNLGGEDVSSSSFGIQSSIGQDLIGIVSSSANLDWMGFRASEGRAFTAYSRIDQLKTLADNTYVGITGKIVTTANGEVSGCFYIEEENRTSGIRIVPNETVSGLARGDVVSVIGRIATTADQERQVIASAVTITSTHAQLGSLGMNNRSVGGCSFGYFPNYQTGPTGFDGLNNIGLLVQSWGRVTYVGTGIFYINDGAERPVRVLIASVPSTVAVGDYVKVTGISSLSSGSVHTLLSRSAGDITEVTSWDNSEIGLSVPGVNVVALPGIPRYPRPDSVFVGCPGHPGIELGGRLSRYDTSIQQWVTYGIYHETDMFFNCMVGDGYTLDIPEGGSDCYRFERTPVNGDQWVGLPWGSDPEAYMTLIGNPFDESVAWSACRVINGIESKTVAEAITAGWIYRVLKWNYGSQAWESDNLSGSIEARKGYLVYSKLSKLALILPDPSP